jgi:hypothetical protein
VGNADAVPKEARNQCCLVFAEGAVDSFGERNHGIWHALRQEQEKWFVVSSELLDQLVHLELKG